VDLILDGASVHYTTLTGTIDLGGITGTICPLGVLNRIRLGRVEVRAHGTVFLENGKIRLNVTQLNSAPFLADLAAGTADEFDTGRKIAGPLCFGGGDVDDQLFGVVNGQIATLFPVDITDTTISDVALGDTGLSLDLNVAEVSQDADGKGLIVRA